MCILNRKAAYSWCGYARKLKKVSCVSISAVSLSFTSRFLKALAALAPSCSKPQIFKSSWTPTSVVIPLCCRKCPSSYSSLTPLLQLDSLSPVLSGVSDAVRGKPTLRGWECLASVPSPNLNLYWIVLDEENACFWFRGRNQNCTLKSCMKLIWGDPGVVFVCPILNACIVIVFFLCFVSEEGLQLFAHADPPAFYFYLCRVTGSSRTVISYKGMCLKIDQMNLFWIFRHLQSLLNLL